MVRMIEHSLIVRDKDILGGTPVFAGTRVPVRTLLDYLKAGQPLDDFLDDFPTVNREQALALLQLVEEILLERPNASAA
jgi:uncharacterized protein (DUF433 family)